MGKVFRQKKQNRKKYKLKKTRGATLTHNFINLKKKKKS
jgi:hypothetical protein